MLWDQTITQTVGPNEARFWVGRRSSTTSGTANATSQTDRGCGQCQGHSGVKIVDTNTQLIQPSRDLMVAEVGGKSGKIDEENEDVEEQEEHEVVNNE